MLYVSECWAVDKAEIQRIDAVDRWCLQTILDIRQHDFVRNADIHRITSQPPLLSIIKSRRLTFSGHLAWMDEIADASQAIFEPCYILMFSIALKSQFYCRRTVLRYITSVYSTLSLSCFSSLIRAALGSNPVVMGWNVTRRTRQISPPSGAKTE